MERGRTRGRSLLLALVLLLGLAAPARAEGADPTLTAAVEDTAACVLSTVKSPQVGSVGGEWAVLGLARSGYEVPENYYRDYYAAVETYVRDHRGVLHERKYTEYSRVIVALSAIGRDARNVAGYDLTVPLGDYERTIWQGLYGLTAVLRLQQGKASLYRMGDAAGLSAGEGPQPGTGLPGRHSDVVPVPLTRPGTTFGDIAGHANQAAMEALAAREIINGKGNNRFCPDDSMTRAEFAAIVVRALGLTPALRGTFTDVPVGQWYSPYVDTAAAYGIITGVGNGRFSPNGTITRR